MMQATGCRRRQLGATLGLGCALALMLVPAVAAGATRFAAPGGSGPAGSCPEVNPCNIEDAVEDASVADGDEIVLTDGAYNLTETLTVIGEITVRGREPGFAGARVVSNADPSIFMITPAARVRDLTLIKNGDKGQGLLIANGTAERVRVIAPESVACELSSADAGNAVIRDSVCGSGNSAGVLAVKDGVGLEFAVLHGITARSATGPYGIEARGENMGQIVLTATSTIAIGGTAANVAAIQVGGGGARADATFSSSAYATAQQIGTETTLTAPGAGTNVTAAPLLVDPAARDFRQLPGSPTIDAGAEPPTAGGPFDFSGDARIQGSSRDIGADEAPDREKILALLGKKVRAKRTLSFRARCLKTPCGISGRAVVKPRSAGKATRTLKPASASAGETAKLKLKLPKRLARKLKRRGGVVTVKATGFADPVSFAQKVRKGYRVRKR